jgi:3-oxoacyl-(acyl-carrier-protein) synthase
MEHWPNLPSTIGRAAADLQHLNAHATSTWVGDRGELAAVRELFGIDVPLAITSTKSATGHLLGAAGSVAAIFGALALRDQIVPMTLNLEQPDALAEGLGWLPARGIGRMTKVMKRLRFAASVAWAFGASIAAAAHARGFACTRRHTGKA